MIEKLRTGIQYVAGQLPETERARLEAVIKNDDLLEKVLTHLNMVAEANQTMNLTSIKDPLEMVVKHAVDCAAVVAMAPVGAKSWLDIGTGAGFPGITVKALLPKMRMSMMDSVQKKLAFVKRVAEALFPVDKQPVTLWGRAEDFAHEKLHREAYDVVSARAVAMLPVLAEYSLPFVRVGGTWIAMKGPGVAEELVSAKRAINALGGGDPEVVTFQLPDGLGERSLVIVKKVRATLTLYPRKAGIPERKPL